MCKGKFERHNNRQFQDKRKRVDGHEEIVNAIRRHGGPQRLIQHSENGKQAEGQSKKRKEDPLAILSRNNLKGMLLVDLDALSIDTMILIFHTV